MKILFLLWLLANAGNSVSTNLVVTDINNANLNYLWGNLSQVASRKPTQLISASEECVNGLLDYLSPKILNLSNYAGLFSANCSVFFDRVLEKVECEIAASNTSLVNNNARRIPGIPLPARYMSQLTLSHILMTQIEADWRGDKYQQQINHLWLSQNPCTASKSDTHSLDTSVTNIALNTDTQDLSPTETKESTPSWFDTISNTLLATKSTLQSLTGSWSSSLNETETLSPTKSRSETVSRTPSSTASVSHNQSQSATPTLSPTSSSFSKSYSQSLSSNFSFTLSKTDPESLSKTSSQIASKTKSKTSTYSKTLRIPPTPPPTPAPPPPQGCTACVAAGNALTACYYSPNWDAYCACGGSWCTTTTGKLCSQPLPYLCGSDTYITFKLVGVFCHATYTGGVTQNTDSQASTCSP